jgi:hypothetical protein
MKKILDWLFGKTENQDSIYRSTIVWTTLLTISVCVCIAFFLPYNPLGGIMTFLMTAAACFAGGGTIGFLFGLPKKGVSKKPEGATGDETLQRDYEDNTNLQEVSDWLTKIIVGLSLVKLNTIRSWADNAATNFAQSYNMDCLGVCKEFNFYVFGYAVIVFYFLVGAGLIYLWTRTNLAAIFSMMARQQYLKSENKKLQEAVQNLANTEQPEEIDPNPDRQELLRLEQNETFRAQTEIIYNSKTITAKDDLQKGRWGGRAFVNNRILEAQYDGGLASVAGLYTFTLAVRSLDAEKPLSGEVAFFLHDTFANPIRYVRSENNKASVKLTAWEAFVVGARLEDGTELELDLNTVKGFPPGFYYKVK